MEARVTLTKKDISRYLFFYLYLKPVGLLYVLVGMIAICCGIFFLTKGNQLGIFLLLFAAIYLALQPYVISIRAKKHAENPYFSLPTVYRFTENGIDITDPENETCHVTWEQIYHISFFREEMFLFFDKDRGNILPLRCFDDGGKKVAAFLATRLPKQKLHGKVKG